MKSKKQVEERMKQLERLRDRCKEQITPGGASNVDWILRVARLEARIDMLEWVFDDNYDPLQKLIDAGIAKVGDIEDDEIEE